MKASLLIEELNRAIQKYGDLEVANDNADTIDGIQRGYGMNDDYIELVSFFSCNLLEYNNEVEE